MNKFFPSDMGAGPTPAKDKDEGLVPTLSKLATAAIVVGGLFLAFNGHVDPRQGGVRTE